MPEPRRRAWPLALGLALAVVVHLVVLYLPGDDVPLIGFEAPGLDKAVHVLTFGVPTLLAVLLVGRLWPALVFLVHAPVSEWAQATFAQDRSGDVLDLAADVLGVALALLAAASWRSRRRRRAAGSEGVRTGGGLDPGVPSAYASGVPSD